MKNNKFSHKTPHLKGKKHQLDPNLDLKQLVHHATVQYVDRDNDGDVDIFDNIKKPVSDENPVADFAKVSKELIKKQKGELKHTKRGMAYEGNLHKWFKSSKSKDGKPGWVNVVTGGTCASDEPGEGVPKCVSSEKRASMTKAERISASRRKKKADPGQQEKSGAAKPTYVSTDKPMEENLSIEEGLLDKLRGRKVVGRTGSGGKVYVSTRPQKSSVTYGGKTQDEIRRDNKQSKVDAKRKQQVKSGEYDDPWLKSSPAAERRLHYQQLRGESVEDIRYCTKCKKKETRNECSYGPSVWDKYSIATIAPTNEEKERDHEYSMARSELATIQKAVKRLKTRMKGEGNIEAWVQSKITKAADYIDAAADYLDSGEHNIEEEKTDCPKGQYFCNRENKCKPIPKGYHLMPNGAIMKDEEHDIEEAKGPCWSGYKQVGMKKKGGKMVPNCVPEETVSEEDVKGKGSGKKDACYKKVKSRYDVWTSAYASGALVKCRKVGAANWGNKSESVSVEDANGNLQAEFIDIIKPEPLQKTEGIGSELVGESVRIPAKTGNIIMVILNWRGKYYTIKMFFPQTTKPNRQEVQDQIEKVYPGARVQSYYVSDIKPGEQFLQTEDWQKVNRQDKTDGLSQKAVDAYRKENPGSKLQTAVTEKNPEGKRAERRKSFCRRMTGMKKRLTSAETARDPDSKINKALRRWNCN